MLYLQANYQSLSLDTDILEGPSFQIYNTSRGLPLSGHSPDVRELVKLNRSFISVSFSRLGEGEREEREVR